MLPTTVIFNSMRRFGGEWIILLRIHPDVAMESTSAILPDFVKNASFYPDSQELVAVSDIMISDYSSIMFEHAFVKRPVFRYAPDVDEYVEKEQGLLMDYNLLLFPLARSNDDLEECILNFDIKMFSLYFVHEDGKAADRSAQFIIHLLKGKG